MKKRISVVLLTALLLGLTVIFAASAAEDTITAYCEHCGTDKVWYPVTSNTTNLDGADHGHYYLTADRVLTGQSISKTVCFNLNGKKYTANRPVTVNSGGTLSIQNGEMLARGNNTSGATTNQPTAGVYVKAGGTLNMKNVSVSYQDDEPRTFEYGGLFRVEGTMNAEGVTLGGGRAAVQGGNIFVGTTGQLSLADCQVTDGYAPAGSCIYAAGKVTLSGSTSVYDLQLVPATGGPSLSQMLTLQGACTGSLAVQVPGDTPSGTVLATLDQGDLSQFDLSVSGTRLDLAEESGALVLKASDFAAKIGDQSYSTLTEALAVLPEGGQLQLLRDADALTLDKSATVDLNGYYLNALTAENGTVYVMDSRTADFDISDDFYGIVKTVSGDVQAAAATADSNPYLMIQDDSGTSFHAVGLNIKSMALRPADVGLYFKNDFAGDAMVRERLTAFGVALSLTGAPDETTLQNPKHFTRFGKELFGGGEALTGTLLTGVLKETNGYNTNVRNSELQIYGRGYAEFGEGQYLFGVTRQRSLRQQVELADARYTEIDGDQREGLRHVYKTYERIAKKWNLSNVNGEQNYMETTDLLVNNLDTPLGIDTSPIFRWINIGGKAQTAYQIIVASTQELAESHVGDMWDSGKVSCGDNFDIPYAGKDLSSCTDYYWAVRVWDETGAEGLWSHIGRFGTGMLEQTDWTAKWIGGTVETSGNQTTPAPMLRKSFELAEGIKNATVYVCGLGLYEMQINGQLPDDSVLNPAHTQYEDTIGYNAYDVTDLLTAGENAIAVELGNGNYNLTTNITLNLYNGVWRDDPKLLLELHVEYANGETQVILSDESWRCYDDGPIRVNNVFCGEQYDATMEVEGWTEAGFDDSGWNTVRMADTPVGKLRFENMEPMRRVKTVTPTVKRIDDSTWRVYTGEYCTGWAKIAFNAPKDTQIEIRYYQRESEIANGLHVENGGETFDLQSYTYRCKGVPGETYEPKFSYAGYEVIEITGYTGELRPQDVACYTVANDVKHIGSFESGNETVNLLHAAMVRTMLCNMQGKPTDTPVFEKTGWTGDFNGAIKTFNFNFDTSNFTAQFMHNIRDTAYGSRINEYSPSGKQGPSESPTWTQAYVNAIYEAWKTSGQFSLAQEHYEFMCTHADYWIQEINEEEPWIWEWRGRLGDWASPHGTISPTTMPSEGGTLYDTAAVCRVMGEMAEIAAKMGDTEAAQKYQDAADNIRTAFHETFYNEEKGYYESGYWNGETNRTQYRQSSNLVALYFGLCPEEYHDTVLNNLIADIESKNYHLDVGHVGAELILPVLSREGYGDVAMKILLQRTYPSWGYWLELGANTALEGWSRYLRSYCHYFLGTYDEWFYQNLAGIQDPVNGYETVTIRPEVYEELGYVNASVETVRGTLVSNWKVEADGRVTMQITVPVGTTAEILLPVADSSAVQLNGAALAEQDGLSEIGVKDGRVMMKAISGSYNFVLEADAVIE